MDESEIYAALTEILRDVFMRDDIAAAPALRAEDVAGWDSFKQIDIILAIEERCGIKLTTREIDGLQQVADLVRVVATKTRRR